VADSWRWPVRFVQIVEAQGNVMEDQGKVGDPLGKIVEYLGKVKDAQGKVVEAGECRGGCVEGREGSRKGGGESGRVTTAQGKQGKWSKKSLQGKIREFGILEKIRGK
jgi:hypothetical protein